MKRKFFISFLISSLCFMLVFAGVDRYINNISGDMGVEARAPENDERPVIDKEPRLDKSVLVLLMGVDGTNIKQEKGLRTDTMMLGKANFETGQIDLLSIPRDTRVKVRGREDKINHAHSYGGPDLALKTVEDFLDLEIDYYVKVDFTGIKEIVDAIGGVEIDVPQRMKYYDPVAKPPLRIDLQAGKQTLNGQKAHDFLRFRRYPEGDIGRVRAQQYFMKELVKQTLKPSNIFKMDKLIKTYYDYVDTNISLPNMLKYALSANKLDVNNMRTEMVPGHATTLYPNGQKASYWIYDRLGTEELVEDMFGEYREKSN